VSLKADIEAKNGKEGWTALHYAAEEGHAGSVSFLLQAHADPQARDSGDGTPLHLAAQGGHIEAASSLLGDERTETDATDSYKRTPLLCASFKGGPRQGKMAKLLVEAGIPPHPRA